MYYFPHWGSNMAYVIGPERERVCVISWLKIELGLQIKFWINDTLLNM